ncbi:hypothetical protein F4779DRAFT_567477 [Xylariaceae sp. FL0662B]|nr:hypothetical protein F4779DRAFT_567477 [Xylariaceae sp. FL0662B]
MAAADVVNPVSLADDMSKKRKAQVDEIEVDLSLPEPPSKKAKRLLKKGKPLPVKPDSDAEPEDDDLPVPKGSKDGKEKRSEHGVWIGNLPFTLTRVELFKWLVECSGGAIKEENITRVNLPTRKADGGSSRRQKGEEAPLTPRNRGFAYVDFDTEVAAVAAMALTETELAGRKVLIKNAKSFEGRPQKESAAAENGQANGASTNGGAAGKKNIPSRKIYVGNLSFQTGEDDLYTLFEKCGDIDWVKVATFEDTGKCKGYGWVKFKEPESAEWAVKGFVKIKEEIETEDDFRDEKDRDGGDGEKVQEKKFRMRKWWVNRLKGRELKIDYAEDDQVRYKRRLGKDALGGKHKMKRELANTESRPEKPSRTEPSKTGGYGDEGVASYLTGAVVKPQGKKISFD